MARFSVLKPDAHEGHCDCACSAIIAKTEYMKTIALLFLLNIFCLTAQNRTSQNFCDLLGEEITIEGTAKNAKMGAILTVNDVSFIWMNNMLAWPEKVYGKTITVSGTVIEKFDLPVFVPCDGQHPLTAPSGIPVPEGTDLHEASRRYLLKDADWKVVQD